MSAATARTVASRSHSLRAKFLSAMMLVLVVNGAGYFAAIQSARSSDPSLATGLENIFVATVLLSMAVALVLPRAIARSAVDVMHATRKLATGTLADLSKSMHALASGDVDAANARVDIEPVPVRSDDEVGQMAASFNTMQAEIARAAFGLDGARDGLRLAQSELEETNANLARRAKHDAAHLVSVIKSVGSAIGSVNAAVGGIDAKLRTSKLRNLAKVAAMIQQHQGDLAGYLSSDVNGRQLPGYLKQLAVVLTAEQREIGSELTALIRSVQRINQIVASQQHSQQQATNQAAIRRAKAA
jgi:methyl-accepting chemotaxis protein